MVLLAIRTDSTHKAIISLFCALKTVENTRGHTQHGAQALFDLCAVLRSAIYSKQPDRTRMPTKPSILRLFVVIDLFKLCIDNIIWSTW